MFSSTWIIVKFDFDIRMCGTHQKFIGVDKVLLGETIEAEMTMFFCFEYFKNCLAEGMEFELWEGKTVGTGVINKIINKDLIKSD